MSFVLRLRVWQHRNGAGLTGYRIDGVTVHLYCPRHDACRGRLYVHDVGTQRFHLMRRRTDPSPA